MVQVATRVRWATREVEAWIDTEANRLIEIDGSVDRPALSLAARIYFETHYPATVDAFLSESFAEVTRRRTMDVLGRDRRDLIHVGDLTLTRPALEKKIRARCSRWYRVKEFTGVRHVLPMKATRPDLDGMIEQRALQSETSLLLLKQWDDLRQRIAENDTTTTVEEVWSEEEVERNFIELENSLHTTIEGVPGTKPVRLSFPGRLKHRRST